ncbi:S-layer homology domain-containing protein [Paenibacillus sp. P36]|uniref:S-layer homology domain-containing protein n=1 Tax=Paenibacillus sp. P36 TaxID=3342538 RepID=UPI0038B3E24E
MKVKKMMTGSLLTVFAATMIVGGSASVSAEDTPSYTLTVLTDKPSKGENVEVLIKGHQLKDVYAYEINLDFNPKQLKLKEATTEIPGFSVPPIVKDNHIQLAHTRIGRTKGDDGEQILYKLKFEAIDEGKAELAIGKVKLVDSILASTDQDSNAKVAVDINDLFPFDDLGDFTWAKTAIAFLAEKGIVNGTAERTFSPGQPVTRADFVVLLMRALEVKGGSGERFDDVQQGEYFDEHLSAARSLGIVEGDEYNNFHPRESVTREDMMTLTARTLKTLNKLPASKGTSLADSFNDTSEISDYAIQSVTNLVEMGLVDGYGEGIHPKEFTNRAQAAMLIYKLLTAK